MQNTHIYQVIWGSLAVAGVLAWNLARDIRRRNDAEARLLEAQARRIHETAAVRRLSLMELVALIRLRLSLKPRFLQIGGVK